MGNKQLYDLMDTNPSLSNMIIEHLQEGILILNIHLHILSLNSWAQKVTQYSKEEIVDIELSQLFLDKFQYKKMLQELKSQGKWVGEVWKRRKNGEIYPEWMNIQAVKSSENTISHYCVVFRDMSKQKSARNELILAEKALENTSEGVLITDLSGRIISVNPAFEIVTGYSEAEVFRKNPSILQSGIHDECFYQNMWEDIINFGNWKGEIWNKRKDGEIYPEWINISSIKDENGKVTNFVAVFSDITDRKLAEEQLIQLAHMDTLTGVANRHSLNERLQSILNTAHRHKQQLALLFLDLDRFKYINDTFGHNYGDMLLKHVSVRIKSLLKNKDIIARLGGDEFVIVLPNIKHPKEAKKTAQQIIDSLAHSFLIENQEIYVSTSIGISLYPYDGMTKEDLVRNADKAMYKAKSMGRNKFEFYHVDFHENESTYFRMETKLRKSLDKDEFFLVYHPILDMKKKKINGVEALLRWNQEDLGVIFPGHFIPLSEETGLILPISDWVIRKAFEDLKQIQLAGFSQMRMNINISALYFNQDDLYKRVLHIINETNVNPHFIDFELTESMIMTNASATIDKLVKLKKLGIKLSVDDFGTGYSSLSYLNRFPIDSLKIDQSFIQKSCSYHEDASIVEAIITMAHKLHLQVVAEGVENQKQFQFLLNESCDFIQGYYITEPLTFSELLDFLDVWDREIDI
ncbi:EAL domain-containing protein [Cytobacillus sp. Hz8]|uniref:sensor domain-containing protein n=1 Tax=Cytobacillus sp. Hz8 TaxID=3347168 RepID=UPI0035E07584